MRRRRRSGPDLKERAAKLRSEAPTRPAVVALDLFAPGEVKLPTPTRQAARSGDLLESGPHRFYLASIAGALGQLRLVDRETGEELQRGHWIAVTQECERRNGLT
jgi:hypothetical protein